MGVLLNWAAATVLGGLMGASAVGFCPSHNVDGVPLWPIELRTQLRHDVGLDKRMPTVRRVSNGLYWLSAREYEAAFGSRWQPCDGEGPPRAEPEFVLPGTRTMREQRLAECAQRRAYEARWERQQELERADQKARRLARRDPG